ncbi:hypothetical protein OS42_23230 [Dickeya oryzae]
MIVKGTRLANKLALATVVNPNEMFHNKRSNARKTPANIMINISLAANFLFIANGSSIGIESSTR